MRRRGLAVLVAGLLVVSGFGVPADGAAGTPVAKGQWQAVSQAAEADSAALVEAKASGTRVEVTGERGESGDVFANPDGTFTALLQAAPDFSAPRNGWALVFSGKSTGSYWNGDGDNVAKVGPCPTSLDSDCNGIGIARSYFRFDARAMLNKRILSAEFRVFGQYTPSCNTRIVEAWGTSPVSSGTTWNNQPFNNPNTHKVLLGWHNVAFRYGCSQTPRTIEFSAKGAVDAGLSRHGGIVTILLRATGTDDYSWKKFATNPTLAITYNSVPNRPTALSIEGKGCKQSPNEPYVNPRIDNDPLKGPRGPQAAAKATDPDGRSVKVEFEWANYSSDRLGGATTVMKASGSTFSADVPSALAADGAKLAIRARTSDGSLLSGWTSPWCHVVIDRTAPGMPSVTSSKYPECDGPSCQAGGGIGQTGSFNLTPAAGNGDVAGYRYDLHDQPQTYVDADSEGKATVLITPDEDMGMDLYVRAVDRAGNESPAKVYHFFVGEGTAPVGHWRLDGLNETMVRNYASNEHHGTLTLGPATWKTGRHGDGLWMSGTLAGSVTTVNGATGPVVDTSKTFAVSAWAKADRIGGYPAVLSLDGNRTSAFQLQATPEGKWAFAMFSSDVDGGGSAHYRVYSDRPIQIGVWTHLVAIYDAATLEERLYVNGRLAGSRTRATPAWAGIGGLSIGRAQFRGAKVDFWNGTIDEVRAYDRSLSIAEIHQLANLPAVEEAFFPLDERLGDTYVDASGRYHVGAIGASGVTPVAGKVGAGATHFNGTSLDAVATSGPAVRTDTSFTVTAWVKPDLDGYTGSRAAVSQDGNRNSGFYLLHREVQGWTFLLVTSDTDNPSGVFASAPSVRDESSWVHLAGVYDAAAQQSRLYVNGALAAEEPYTAAHWNAAGPLVIGRAKYNGNRSDRWKGAVDDVHVWTGARTTDQILAEYLDPVTARQSPYMGQLSRYWNYDGYHVVTSGPVPPGSHFEGPLGMMAPVGTAGTRTIYSCRHNARDYFLSALADCEGQTQLGAIGGLHINPPASHPAVPVYRCRFAGGPHFASHDVNCEGLVAEGLLGYALAYGQLVGSLRPSTPADHATSLYYVAGGYRGQQKLGLAQLVGGAGTVPLMMCRDGEDLFSSTDTACEGKAVVRQTGVIWTPGDGPPQGVAEFGGLFRCRTRTGELFEADNPGCNGEENVSFLGYTIKRL